MRAIDADAIISQCEEYSNLLKYDGTTDREWAVVKRIILIIKEQPTIEPQRKKGHWIRHPEQRNIFNGKTIECSECHEKYTVQYVEDELFCRHCGADMTEDE